MNSNQLQNLITVILNLILFKVIKIHQGKWRPWFWQISLTLSNIEHSQWGNIQLITEKDNEQLKK